MTDSQVKPVPVNPAPRLDKLSQQYVSSQIQSESGKLEAVPGQSRCGINPQADDYRRSGGAALGILMTHGLAGSTYDLRPLADWLNDKLNATVLIKRLAGHGMTLRDWRQSLNEGLAELHQCDHLFLIGNSFGGNLMIDLALRCQRPVAGLVLLSTPIFTNGEWWQRAILPLVIPWRFSIRKHWIKYEGEADYLKRGSYLEVPLATYREFLWILRFISREQVPEIHQPTLMIYSKHDVVIKPHSAEYIYRRLPSRDKQLFWLDDSYHSPLSSKRTADVFREVTEFIKRHCSTGHGAGVL